MLDSTASRLESWCHCDAVLGTSRTVRRVRSDSCLQNWLSCSINSCTAKGILYTANPCKVKPDHTSWYKQNIVTAVTRIRKNDQILESCPYIPAQKMTSICKSILFQDWGRKMSPEYIRTLNKIRTKTKLAATASGSSKQAWHIPVAVYTVLSSWWWAEKPPETCRAAFLKLWSADHKWSSGSALVVLSDWTLVQKRQKK